MAPDIQAIVGDNLCQPHALHRLISEGRLQPLVIGACSKLGSNSYLWKRTADLDSTRIVDLVEETATPVDNTEIADRVKILLWAQVRRARGLKGIHQDNLKLHISRASARVSRRELFATIVPRYEVVPSIEQSKCIGVDRCRLCHDSCPLKAIVIDGDEAIIDKSACCGCGACVTACPEQAISYPTFSLEELDNEMEGLLLNLGVLQPRIIALTCRGCLPKGDEEGRLMYPPSMLPLRMPCLAMAHPWLMLRAFDLGAQGLALIKGKCRPGFDADTWRGNIRFVQAVLECWNIKGRIRAFEAADNNDIVQELDKFAREIARLGQIPVSSCEPTPVSPEGRRLPGLIKGLRDKLPHSQSGTISNGIVPFGRIELDETRCTGCGLCALSCPTGALAFVPGEKPDTKRLLFSHEYCIGCGVCVRDCPEKCLRLERVLDLEQLGRQAIVLFECSIARCRQCRALIAPKPMLARLESMMLEQGRATEHLDLCPACRMGSASSSVPRSLDDISNTYYTDLSH
jgi:ferredoxin